MEKNKNGNKILFIIAVCLLVVLLSMVFLKLFIYKETDKEYMSPKDVDPSLITKLTSYLDIANLDNEITFYAGSYVTSNNLSYSAVGKMIYNYIKLYDTNKLEVVSNKENCLYRIKSDEFLTYRDKLLENSNFYLDQEHYNSFNISDNLYAKVEGEYLYIYKKEIEDSIYKYYHGLYSYTLMDNNNTIILTEYYIRCNKTTYTCYNNTKENPMEVNNVINYSDNFDASVVTDRLTKYNHVFKKFDGEYKWVSVDVLR